MFQNPPPGFVIDQPQSGRRRVYGPAPQPTPESPGQTRSRTINDTRTQQQIEAFPADQQREATRLGRLPDAVMDDLTRDVDAFSALNRAASGFQDAYSGPGVPPFDSDWENWFQERLGTGTPGQRQWWADFSAADNAARNRLFGASLSEGEQAAFARTTISPNMTPDQVRANIEQRLDLARSALRRRVEGLRAQGYNEQAINAMLGDAATILNAPQQAAQSQGGPPVAGERGSERMDYTQQRVGADSQRERVMIGSDEEFDRQRDPALRGVNARYRQMLRSGASRGQLLAFLRQHGIDPRSVTNFDAQLQWRAQHPRSQWHLLDTNIDQRFVRRTPVERTLSGLADNPVGAFAVSNINNLTGNRLDNVAELLGGNGDLVNAGAAQLRSDYPVSSIAGDVAAGATLWGAGRAALARGASMASRGGAAAAPATGALSPRALAGDAALGAYIGSGSEGTDPLSLSGTLRGAAGGVAGGIVGRGTINAVGRAASPTGGELAPLYREGVRPTLGQRVGGAADRVEQAFTSVPFVGGIQRAARNRAVDDFQVGAFNQSLREIGLQLPRRVRAGTRAHLFTQRAFDREFRQVRSRARFVPDGEFARRFGEILQDLETLPQDSQTIFRNLVERDFATRLRAGGNMLSGDSYLRVASRLDRVARRNRNSQNGDSQLAELLEGMSEAIDEAAARNTPGLADRLRRARSGYRNLVVIEDAARRRGTGTGRFSPTQFDAAVQNIGGGLRSRAYLRGQAPMQQYAEAGLRLGDDLPNSGTADRWMSAGAPFVLGGLGYVNPLLLTPWAASTAATLPGVRGLVNVAVAPNRPALAPLRRQLQRNAYLGGVIGAPVGALGLAER